MPRLPNVLNTWRHRVNLSCNESSDQDHRARLLLEIKLSMVSGASGWTDSDGVLATPSTWWTVAGSSDGVAADSSDRWSEIADLVWETNGTAHSWIVLEHRDYFASGVGLQILFDCSQSGGTVRNAAIGVYISAAGFNLGAPSILNRPTATDELEVLPADGSAATAPWQGADTNDAIHRSGRLHFQMTEDARRFRWWIARSGFVVGRGDFFPADEYDRTTDWDRPFLSCVYSADALAERMTWDLARSDSDHVYVGTDGLAVGDFTARLECPCSTTLDTASVNQPAVTFNGSFGGRPVTLAGVAPLSGSFAAPPDLWWGNATSRYQGFPGDGSNQFVQMGDFVTPWNRSTPLFS